MASEASGRSITGLRTTFNRKKKVNINKEEVGGYKMEEKKRTSETDEKEKWTGSSRKRRRVQNI